MFDRARSILQAHMGTWSRLTVTECWACNVYTASTSSLRQGGNGVPELVNQEYTVQVPEPACCLTEIAIAQLLQLSA